jgi:hypothetical protein
MLSQCCMWCRTGGPQPHQVPAQPLFRPSPAPALLDCAPAAAVPQTVYNCPGPTWQTCTNDYNALGECVDSANLLVDANLIAQTYANGNCRKSANQDVSRWLLWSCLTALVCSDCRQAVKAAAATGLLTCML